MPHRNGVHVAKWQQEFSVVVFLYLSYQFKGIYLCLQFTFVQRHCGVRVPFLLVRLCVSLYSFVATLVFTLSLLC